MRRNDRRITRMLPLAAIVALALVPGSAVPGSAATGSANTTNTVLRATVGTQSVAVGVDETKGALASNRSALARFIAGDTAEIKIGKVEKQGTADSDSGRDETEQGTLSVDGLVDLTVIDAAADISLSASQVASEVAATLADVRLLNGLVSFDGLVSAAKSDIDQAHAVASRTITLDGVEVFDIGALFAALGIDPLALTCAAVQNTGAALGVDTSSACASLQTIEDSMQATGSALDAAATSLGTTIGNADESQAQAAYDAAAALSCELTDLTCTSSALTTLLGIASTYGITLSDPTDLAVAKQEVLAGLEAILVAFDDLRVVQAGITATGAGTCATVGSAIDTVVADISTADPAGVSTPLADIGSDLAAACAALGASVDTLMGTPLVRIDDVVISLLAEAKEDDPVATVTVSIGSITVGLEAPVALPLDDSDAIAEHTATIEAAISEVLAATGLALPQPQLELFGIATDKGSSNGTWFADATLTTVRLELPASTVELPDVDPLAVLAQAGPTAPTRAATRAAAELPAAVVEAGVFEASSDYVPAAAAECTGDDCVADECTGDDCAPDGCTGDDCGDDDCSGDDCDESIGGTRSGRVAGELLPRTGTASDMARIAGMLLIALAVVTRRFALR